MLAQSVKILNLESIVGADRIEVASVLAYKVVCQKGLYEIGQIAIFIVPDTVVPRASWSEFLFKGDQAPKDKVRLKICRLRGQVSFGLLVPLSETGQVCPEEGVDFTEILAVEKYEKSLAECLNGDAVGSLPYFCHKTDEDNLRSNMGAFAELQGKEVYITQKVDGSSGTFFFKDGQFGACSRKLQLVKTESNSFWSIAKKYDLENKLRDLGKNICVQGEVFGESIQGNKLEIKGRDIRVFDVSSTDTREYVGYQELCNYCAALGLPMVKVIHKGVLTQDIEELIALANSQTYSNGKPCEGIVIRPVEPIHSEILGRRLSVKVISEKFSLKHGE